MAGDLASGVDVANVSSNAYQRVAVSGKSL
jgi:hypothetical protein